MECMFGRNLWYNTLSYFDTIWKIEYNILKLIQGGEQTSNMINNRFDIVEPGTDSERERELSDIFRI